MAHEPNRTQSGRLCLLALLILTAMLFLYLRRDLFLGSPDAAPSRAGEEKKGTPASPVGPRNLQEASTTPGAAIPPQGPATNDSSESWYVTVAFQGIVRNEANRTPIDGAVVRIYGYSSPTFVGEKTSGDGGRYRIVAPPSYRYGVKVEAQGFRPYQDDSLVITRPYYEMDILLTPVFALRGRVVDAQNVGIADAQIQMRRVDDRGSAMLTVTTDARGIFTFPEVPRSGGYYVEAYHSGYDALGLASVKIPTENDVIIKMQPARSTGSISGAVSDKRQNRIVGADVSLYDPSDGRLLSTTTSDRLGGYKFARAREGYYIVRCLADGFAETATSQGIVPVNVDKEARLDFTLDPGLMIRGVVVNQKEEPVVQAQVTYTPEDAPRPSVPGQEGGAQASDRANPRGGAPRTRNLGMTTTDSEGRFQILGLPDTSSQYQISVSHRDYPSLVTRLRPSNDPQVLVLDSGLALKGTVSDGRGAAVERFTLTFRSGSGRSEKSYSFTTTEGHFEIHGLARDSYQVSLQAGGRGRFAGTLDLQASTEIFVVLDGGRGGRSQSSLNVLKAK